MNAVFRQFDVVASTWCWGLNTYGGGGQSRADDMGTRSPFFAFGTGTRVERSAQPSLSPRVRHRAEQLEWPPLATRHVRCALQQLQPAGRPIDSPATGPAYGSRVGDLQVVVARWAATSAKLHSLAVKHGEATALRLRCVTELVTRAGGRLFSEGPVTCPVRQVV